METTGVVDALMASPEAYVALDPELRVVFWNSAAEEMTGFSADQALGDAPPLLTSTQHDALSQSLATFDRWRDAVPAVVSAVNAEGRPIEVYVTRWVRLHDDRGGPGGYGVFFRALDGDDDDPSEPPAGEVATTLERFRRIDQHRVDWVAGIVHDLRTPVTAVLGFARTLRRAADLLSAEERNDALDVIERQSLRISRMLDDLMDTARAEAGQLVHDRFRRVPLHEVVTEAVLITAPEDAARMTLDLDDQVIVEGDPEQLTRVVQNLVVNALRHAGDDAGITIGVAADAATGVVSVVDTGRGLPEDMEPFTRFSHGDDGGIGLGLFTVKRIVELHGGTIDVSDTPGGGTTVEVRLPRAG